MSLTSRVVALAVTSGALLVATDAHAQPSPKDEITALETQLASEATALSTADCTSACRALASIRRAADKICALDSGDRCSAARAKADDATKRVRAACPDCAIASVPGGTPAPPPPAPMPEAKPADMPAHAKGGDPATAANAPPSESRRGGCAGCATTKATHGDLAGVALVVALLVRSLRRRRND